MPVRDVVAPNDASWIELCIAIVEFAGTSMSLLHQLEISASGKPTSPLGRMDSFTFRRISIGLSDTDISDDISVNGSFSETLTSSKFYKNTKISSYRFCEAGSRHFIDSRWDVIEMLLMVPVSVPAHSPHLLSSSGDGTKTPTITSNVYIHPSVKVHPSTKIGCTVSMSVNARIGAGVRLISCIICDDVENMEDVVVIHLIVGWKSSIGRLSRVQACPAPHFVVFFFHSFGPKLLPM